MGRARGGQHSTVTPEHLAGSASHAVEPRIHQDLSLYRRVLHAIVGGIRLGALPGRTDDDAFRGRWGFDLAAGGRALVDGRPDPRVRGGGIGVVDVKVKARIGQGVCAGELGTLGCRFAVARDVEVEARHVELGARREDLEAWWRAEGEVEGDDLARERAC